MDIVINGLCLGGVYALIALGYTMVYGIAKMLNFAHGDIIMVGAYTIYVFMALSMNMIWATLIAIVLCIILGIVVEKVAYKPLRGASPLAVLITAIGVSYLLQGIAQLLFGTSGSPKSTDSIVLKALQNVFKTDLTTATFTVPNLGFVTIFGEPIPIISLISLGVCILFMVGLYLFVNKTRTGRAMQAVSQDKDAAILMGINPDRIIAITFAIGSALAAVAGLFYLILIPSVGPTLGQMPGIKAFTAAVIGGIGSLPGAMIGGVLLGIIEKICSAIPVLSPYTTAIEFGILVIILIVKPTGFLGKKIREKV